MADAVAPPPGAWDLEVDVAIVGAGACGLVAALAAREAGAQPLVIEADAVPAGSTALSAGLIPAAGTRLQHAAGIADDPVRFAADIQAKAGGENPQALVDLLAREAGPAVDWLEAAGLPFSVVDGFDYPGHSRRRMHGLPTRSGRELVDGLRSLAEARGVDLVCGRRVRRLFAASGAVAGLEADGPDGPETVGARAVILACNGFGGDRAMVARHMPGIADALWFGHDGNRGDAVRWGAALGARTAHLGAYQGHGNVAHPHGILISWATISEGGVQVNAEGRRFWNEAQGYSEAARVVLSQPGGVAWTVFDARIAAVARQFEDFRQAEAAGAVREGDDPGALAEACGLPADALAGTLAALPRDGVDGFGRRFAGPGLAPPYRAVKVTGALFHTQGGLVVDGAARVLGDGGPVPGLYAAGGAAQGVSGRGDSGYLSGNGLLAAVALGRVAGRAAAGRRGV